MIPPATRARIRSNPNPPAIHPQGVPCFAADAGGEGSVVGTGCFTGSSMKRLSTRPSFTETSSRVPQYSQTVASSGICSAHMGHFLVVSFIWLPLLAVPARVYLVRCQVILVLS